MNPKAVKKPVISSTEVNEFLVLSETIQALKKRVELLSKSLNDSESTILAKIDSGADISKCGFMLFIKETEKRFPAWKEHFISNCGKEAADQVLNNTEAKLYRDLVIKKVA